MFWPSPQEDCNIDALPAPRQFSVTCSNEMAAYICDKSEYDRECFEASNPQPALASDPNDVRDCVPPAVTVVRMSEQTRRHLQEVKHGQNGDPC